MSLDRRSALQALIQSFTPEALAGYLRAAAPTFRPRMESLDAQMQAGMPFDRAQQVGVIELPAAQTVLVAAVHTPRELTSRSAKKVQYDLAKALIKAHNSNAGLLAFYDDAGHFRFSLVTAHYYGTRRQFSNFRRYTFFVAPDAPNKTFVNQIGRADLSSLESILKAFSIEALSEDFYKEFKPRFDAIAQSVAGKERPSAAHEDFALLFVIRTIFLGFVQKKGWLGGNPRFLQAYWEEYQAGFEGQNRFYCEWLEPLFFEALNAPPGRKVAYGHAPFTPATQQVLQMAPYLNGELFKRKREVDDQGLEIPDAQIDAFFDFLFQYNFTVEENELYDEELELNPEFLGIIFERLTNKDQGAVYTPRVEVDLMCRLALVKWLEGVTAVDREDLYHFFFREAGTGETYDEHQKQGDFSPAEIRALVERLSTVAACDPAAGSGAFEVGMLQVLDQSLANLYSRNNTPADLKTKAPTPFERRKAIIANSLYGVEVKRWAVWINHLRLWLSLFVDMPDEFQHSLTPLLPNLTFKVHVGDSLVQRLGNEAFPVRGHAAALSATIKRQITELKQRKHDFFYNASEDYRSIAQAELGVFRAILDAQIENCRAEIAKLLEPQLKQGELLPLGPKQTELDAEVATAMRRTALQAEIAALELQKRTLHEQHPFFWSIEFAEIFFGRGGFDIIIGNPPYVRQEDISDPCGHLTPQAYKVALQEMLLLDFPDYFAHSRAKMDTFKKDRKPSGRSDLYTYFYIRSLRLLNSQGVHVFICSNSWLDMSYGAWMQEFFLRQAPLYLVIDNHARRSFTSAEVNTVITVAGATGQPLSNTKFIAFKQPFEDIVLSNNLLDIESALKPMNDERFRVFAISIQNLLAEGREPASEHDLEIHGGYVGGKWGAVYLRAPDVYLTIQEKCKEQLVHLDNVAAVQRGFTTGANKFFYLETVGPGSRPGLLRVRNDAGWEGEIEDEYVVWILTSPRESYGITVSRSTCANLFLCNQPLDKIKNTHGFRYIRWGEKQGYHLKTTCKSRNRWYDLGSVEFPKAAWPRTFFERHICYEMPEKTFCSDRFYGIQGENLGTTTLAWLNSTFVSLFVEVNGYQVNHGGIDTSVWWLQRLPVLSGSYQELEQIYGSIRQRNIELARLEVSLPDRRQLDESICEILGLSYAIVDDLYEVIPQMVAGRILKARRELTKKEKPTDD